MCGIAGILFKKQKGPLGELLVKMLTDLNRRGPDSTGVALYSNLSSGNLVVRIKVEEDAEHETTVWEDVIVETARQFGSVQQSSRSGYYVRLIMDYYGAYEPLASALEECGRRVEVFSMGRHLEIIKQMGFAPPMDRTYGL